jgi:hypothetical protein
MQAKAAITFRTPTNYLTRINRWSTFPVRCVVAFWRCLAIAKEAATNFVGRRRLVGYPSIHLPITRGQRNQTDSGTACWLRRDRKKRMN